MTAPDPRSAGHGRRVVLASASPARLRQLVAAGIQPDVVVSGVDEDGLDHLAPLELVRHLAEAKADAVAARFGGDAVVVVGADSMFEVDGELFGKPGTPERATERWLAMRGRRGDLHTGHCVIDVVTGRRASATATTSVTFAAVTDAEIASYVATGEPLLVAGAFTLDGRAAPFVERVDGDPGNVLGLSLPLLRRLLAELDIAITDLWS